MMGAIGAIKMIEGARKALRKPYQEAVKRIHRAFDGFVDEMPGEMTFVDCLALAQRIREYAESIDRVLGNKLCTFVTSMRNGMRQRAHQIEQNARIWFGIPPDGQGDAPRAVERFPQRSAVQGAELLEFMQSLGPRVVGGAYLSQYAGTTPVERVRADALPSPKIQLLNRAILRIDDTLTVAVQGRGTPLTLEDCRTLLEENARTAPTLAELLASSDIPPDIIGIFERSIASQREQMLRRLPEFFGVESGSPEAPPEAPTISREEFAAIVRDVGKTFINVSADGGADSVDLSRATAKKREALGIFHGVVQAFASGRAQRIAMFPERMTLDQCLRFIQSLEEEELNFQQEIPEEIQDAVRELVRATGSMERPEMERRVRERFGEGARSPASAELSLADVRVSRQELEQFVFSEGQKFMLGFNTPNSQKHTLFLGMPSSKKKAIDRAFRVIGKRYGEVLAGQPDELDEEGCVRAISQLAQAVPSFRSFMRVSVSEECLSTLIKASSTSGSRFCRVCRDSSGASAGAWRLQPMHLRTLKLLSSAPWRVGHLSQCLPACG